MSKYMLGVSRLRLAICAIVILCIGASLFIEGGMYPKATLYSLNYSYLSYAFLALAFVFISPTILNAAKAWRAIVNDLATKRKLGKDDWNIEETRGIFALGIIGTIIVVRTDKNVIAMDSTGYLLFAMNVMLACWVAYSICMAIALPNEWISQRVRIWSFLSAQLLFVFGVVITVAVGLTGFVTYVLSDFKATPLYPWIIGITVCLSSFGVALLFFEPREEFQTA